MPLAEFAALEPPHSSRVYCGHPPADRTHPADGTGHRYLAELLIHAVQQAAREAVQGVPAQSSKLPTPMMEGNEVSAHQLCYSRVRRAWRGSFAGCGCAHCPMRRLVAAACRTSSTRLCSHAALSG